MIKNISKKKIIKALKETLDLNRIRLEECSIIPTNKDGSAFEIGGDFFGNKIPELAEPHYMKLEILFKCPFNWKVIK